MNKNWIGVCAIALTLAGCEKAVQNMYDQPRYKSLAPSTLWPDGMSARTAPPGTVMHSAGASAGTSSGRLGEQPLPEGASATDTRGGPNRLPPSMETLRRGRERYEIYCSPCHGAAGDGDGMVVRRGFPRPPSYHDDNLRNAANAHFYSVITNGYGVMYPYADRIEARDRWAIVAYIRALQLSRNARLADVPEAERSRLEGIGK